MTCRARGVPRFALVTSLAVVLASCGTTVSPAPTPTPTATGLAVFEILVRRGGDWDPVPLELIDHTGLVDTVAGVFPVDVPPPGRMTAVPAPDQLGAVLITWWGGAGDLRYRFSVRRVDGALRLLRLTDKPNGCLAVGLNQGVLIDFDDAVGAEELETLLAR